MTNRSRTPLPKIVIAAQARALRAMLFDLGQDEAAELVLEAMYEAGLTPRHVECNHTGRPTRRTTTRRTTTTRVARVEVAVYA